MITNNKTFVHKNWLMTAVFEMFCELFLMFKCLCADFAKNLLIDWIMTELASILRKWESMFWWLTSAEMFFSFWWSFIRIKSSNFFSSNSYSTYAEICNVLLYLVELFSVNCMRERIDDHSSMFVSVVIQ